MDPNQTKSKTSAKDFFLNLGAFIGLYTLVGSLISLLFTVINVAYPQIISGYNYSSSSQSISWPVSTLIVFFPIFILLMWFLEREYRTEPEMQNNITHRGLTYITLFISGLVIAGDLITVVYYFIDGQELTTSFLLKVLVLLVIASSLFLYFISDLRGKLTKKSRTVWRFVSGFIILGSIIWGFAVLGSPRTQQLLKYDQQKVSDLQNINSQIQNYFYDKNILPAALAEMSNSNYSFSPINATDKQTNKPYEYIRVSKTEYQLCAEFNKALNSKDYPTSWEHDAGHFCFKKVISSNNLNYPKTVPLSIPVQ